jgi:O-antigen ligase
LASRARRAAAPVYLFACLLLGGSAQGIWANMLLQVAGVGLIAWAAFTPAEDPLTRSARQLFVLAILGLALIVLQLVPLPPSIWSHIPGHEPIAAGYRLLGIEAPALPMSVAPYATFATFLTLIPPLAMLCMMTRMGFRPVWLVIALLLGAFGGILLGALQVTSGDPLHSPWYLYERSNFGVATGFFANANHMANLLVVCLPFLAALVASARGGNVQRYSAVAALVAGAIVVIVIGIVLNGSLAGYALALPVLVASAMLVIPSGSVAQRWTGLVAVLLLIAAAGVLWMRPVGTNFSSEAATSVTSRAQMFTTTMAATKEFLPLGSGIGSFPRVYPMFENPDTIAPTIVNHAHNDYAELALETGIPGIVLIALFLVWWAAAARRAWGSVSAGHYARAASIASAAILVHNIVDYPLRTAAISTIFAMCLALLVQRRAPARAEKADLRPTRHMVFR